MQKKVLNKSPSTSKKDRLLSFIQRHNSLSPISMQSSINSVQLCLSKDKPLKPTKSPSLSNLNINSKPSPRLGQISSFPTQESDLGPFLSELKEKLEKVESVSITIESWKTNLANKEKELTAREKHVKEVEKSQAEKEKKLAEGLKRLEKKEKDLKAKEASLVKSKEDMFREISASLEKKSKEIAEQERKLSMALTNIHKELATLNKAKEESIKIECSVLINELIGSIILSDYQNRVMAHEGDSKGQSFEENDEVVVFSSNFSFDKIEEVSNESSFDEDSFSDVYVKRRDKILQDCDEISKENREISDKLEALIATFGPSLKVE